jgi:ABC-type branched-subunit amino acid transport system substrate-binding protein
MGDAGIRKTLKSEVFRASGVTLFAPVTGIDLDPGNRHLVILRAGFADEVNKIVEHATPLGITRIAAVYVADDYARPALDALEKRLAKGGLALAGKYPMPRPEVDIAEAMKKVSANSPQAVVLIGDTIDAARFVKAYRALDAGALIFALSLVNHTALMEVAGLKNARGVVISQVVPHPGSPHIMVAREHVALMNKFRDEAPTHLTLEGFISAKALVHFLRSAESQTVRGAPKESAQGVDTGDFWVNLQTGSGRGSSYVDLTLVTQKGVLTR